MLSVRAIYQILFRHFGPQHWWPAETSFEVIVGAILTQNTNWRNVEKAIENLKKTGLLTVDALARATIEDIERAVRPSGFYRQKAYRLKVFVNYLNDLCGDNLRSYFKKDLVKLRSELLTQKGIGPETADSILLYAGNKPIFVIDTYTRRILARVNKLTFKTYDQYRLYFEQNLAASTRVFNEYHALLVKLAKENCRNTPRCTTCPLIDDCDFYNEKTVDSRPCL